MSTFRCYCGEFIAWSDSAGEGEGREWGGGESVPKPKREWGAAGGGSGIVEDEDGVSSLGMGGGGRGEVGSGEELVSRRLCVCAASKAE